MQCITCSRPFSEGSLLNDAIKQLPTMAELKDLQRYITLSIAQLLLFEAQTIPDLLYYQRSVFCSVTAYARLVCGSHQVHKMSVFKGVDQFCNVWMI